jgi:hypothetical protein
MGVRLSQHIPIASATRAIISIVTSTSTPVINGVLGDLAAGCFSAGRIK